MKSNGAFSAERAAVRGQDVADIRNRTDLVIRRAVDDESRAGNAVAFIADFFVAHAFQLAGALQNGVLDRVLRDIGAAGLDEGETELRVHVGITAAASAGRDDDFTDDLRPHIGALRILTTFAVLDVGPF